MAEMLKIDHICKTFNAGTINEKVALNGVDLTLEDGDFVTVIGGNGAGKSTTLNAVAGVWPVDSGKIFIGGDDVTKLSEYKRAKYLGRVFQDPMTGTATTMSIEENMAIAARRGRKRGLSWVMIAHMFRTLYIDDLADVAPQKPFLDLRVERRVTQYVADHHPAAGFPGSAHKLPHLRLIDREGLFQQHVVSGAEQGNGRGNMLRVHGAVDDGISQLWTGGQCFGAFETHVLRDMVACSCFLAADGIWIGYSDDGQRFRMELRIGCVEHGAMSRAYNDSGNRHGFCPPLDHVLLRKCTYFIMKKRKSIVKAKNRNTDFFRAARETCMHYSQLHIPIER